MTRFARAKGSKSSNERTPEEATSWDDMKRQLDSKLQEIEANKKRKTFDAIRQKNYDEFVETVENEKANKGEWCEFPQDKKRIVTRSLVSTEVISDVNGSDAAIKTTVSNNTLKTKKKKTDTDLTQNGMFGKLMKSAKSPVAANLEAELPSPVVKFKKIKIKQELSDEVVKTDNKKTKSKVSREAIRSENGLRAANSDTLASPSLFKFKKIKIKRELSDELANADVKKTKTKIAGGVIKSENGLEGANSEMAMSPSLVKSKKMKIKPEIPPSTPNVVVNADIKKAKLKVKEKTNSKIEVAINSKKKRKRSLNVPDDEVAKADIKKPKAKVKKPLSECTKEELEIIDRKREKRLRRMAKRKERKKAAMDEKNEAKGIVVVATKTNQQTRPKTRRTDGQHKRRKPELNAPIMMNIGGQQVEIVKYDGFPIRKEDAAHLQELRKKMISKGIPRAEVDRTMKLERRKAEKSLTRLKKNLCFNCRKSGHNLSECPDLENNQTSATGICFKCGSTEHTHFQCKVVRSEDFKFAECFICKEQGHISRQCPDNPRGLYPKGGACKLCGDVTHFKKDCPALQQDNDDDANNVSLTTMNDSMAIEGLEECTNGKRMVDVKKKAKKVTF